MKKSAAKILKIAGLLFIITVALAVAFFIFSPRKPITFIFPDLNKISYINTSIKNDSAFTKISIILQNKNPYKLVIDTVDFELELNDTIIAHQTVSLNIKQSAYESDTVLVPLNLSIKQVMNLIANMQDEDSTNIILRGFAVYETFLGRKKLDFDKNTKIEVPIPPKVKVLKVVREGYSIKEKILKAKATIEIINRGKNLDLKITDIHYDMIVRNTLRSNGVISKPVIIKPRSSVIVTIPIEIEIYNPLKTAWMIGTDNDQFNYSLNVTCNIKENLSEKSFASPASVNATGVLELVK